MMLPASKEHHGPASQSFLQQRPRSEVTHRQGHRSLPLQWVLPFCSPPAFSCPPSTLAPALGEESLSLKEARGAAPQVMLYCSQERGALGRLWQVPRSPAHRAWRWHSAAHLISSLALCSGVSQEGCLGVLGSFSPFPPKPGHPPDRTPSPTRQLVPNHTGGGGFHLHPRGFTSKGSGLHTQF